MRRRPGSEQQINLMQSPEQQETKYKNPGGDTGMWKGRTCGWERPGEQNGFQ